MWDEKDQTFPHVLTSIFNSQHNYRWFCQLVVSSAFWTEASCPQQAHTRTNKKKVKKQMREPTTFTFLSFSEKVSHDVAIREDKTRRRTS